MDGFFFPQFFAYKLNQCLALLAVLAAYLLGGLSFLSPNSVHVFKKKKKNPLPLFPLQ